jgi:methyltransferase-like protein
MHGLGYVGDANISTMFLGNLPAQAVEKLKAVNDVILQEQYMDFVLNRRFRTSILCKNSQTGKINRALKEKQIFDYYLSAAVSPEGTDPKQPIDFKAANGSQFTTHNEIAGTLYLELAACGLRPVAAADLVKTVQKKLKLKTPEAVEKELMQSGLHLALRGLLNLQEDSPAFLSTVSRKPVCHPLARHEASRKNCKSATNALYNNVSTDMLSNICIRLADGSRTAADIADHLMKMAAVGEINVSRDNKRLTGEQEIRAELLRQVESILQKCADQALLTG